MPMIVPEYESKIRMQVPQLPMVPEGVAGQPGREVAQAGKEVAEVGMKLDQQLQAVDRARSLSQAISQASTRISDLRAGYDADPAFNSNPTMFSARFDADAKKVREEASKSIGDEMTRMEFQAAFDRSLLAHRTDLRNDIRRKQIDLGRAEGETGYESRLKEAMSGSQLVAGDAMTRHDEDVDRFVAGGIYRAEEGAKRKQQFREEVAAGHGLKGLRVPDDGRLIAERDRIEAGDGIYGPLPEQVRSSLIGQYDRELDHRQAERERLANRAEREREKQEREAEKVAHRMSRELVRRSDDAIMSIAELGQEGPIDIEGRLRSIGTHDALLAADEYHAKKIVAEQTFSALHPVSGLSFREQLDHVQSAFAVTPGEQGAREKFQARDMAIRVIHQKMEQFVHDPVSYVEPMLGPDDGQESREDRISRGIAMQAELGEGVPDFKPKLFPEKFSKGWKDSWDKMDTTARLQAMRELESYGEYKRQAVAELGIPGFAQFAHTVDEADPGNGLYAQTLIAAGDTPEEELPGDTRTKNEFRRNTTDALRGNDVWMAMTGPARYQPQNRETSKFAAQLERAIQNTAIKHGSVGKALEMLDATYGAIADESVGFVTYPKRGALTKDQIAWQLREAKNGVGAFLASQKEMFLQTSDTVDMGNRLWDERVRDLTKNGIWVNSPDGNGFILLNPATGMPVVNENGKRFSVNLTDLAIRETARQAEAAPSFIPSNISFNWGQAKSDQFRAMVDAAAAEHGVDAGFIARVIAAESNWDPEAEGKREDGSFSGAVGLMQLMSGTAKDLGVSDRKDPWQNISGGVRYLKTQLDRFGGDKVRALIAYNWGPENAAKWNGDPDELPEETRRYVRKILGYFAIPPQKSSKEIKGFGSQIETMFGRSGLPVR